jgi:o-succinylbenzoate---CoA ligase
MTTPAANEAFWKSEATWVGLPPHLEHDGGLREWAETQVATKSHLFFQTSGSEGRPKWVGLTRAALLASAAAVNAHLQATKLDRWLVALPFHHVGGFSILARCFQSGSHFETASGRWQPEEFVRQCEARGITLVSLVPTQVYDLVKAGWKAPKSLRAVVVGGGGLAKPVGKEARRLGWPVLQSYGMTEACSQVATQSLEYLHREFDPEWLQVLPHWQLGVDAADRLVLRGVSLAAGYAVETNGVWAWEPIDATAGFTTRDRVEIKDVDGRQLLRFLGRESSVVKVKGELVSLSAVQRRLDDLAPLFSLDSPLMVVALPDERGGAKLVAVALQGNATAEQLAPLLERHAAASPPAERIKEIRWVSEFPLSGPGKIHLSRLQEMLAEDFNIQQ